MCYSLNHLMFHICTSPASPTCFTFAHRRSSLLPVYADHLQTEYKKHHLEPSRAYNESIRKNTMHFAILEALRAPDQAFAAAIKAHFAIKAPLVRQQCKLWVQECRDRSTKKAMQGLSKDIELELDKLLHL